MSRAHMRATFPRWTPVWRVGPENAYPGSDGSTTSNASAASPPCATGSVSGPMTARNSTNEPGHPCVITIGLASGSGDRAWTKWIRSPSISVTKCGSSLSEASRARQSYASDQYATSERRYSRSVPYSQPAPDGSCGNRVRRSRSRRSRSVASETSMVNGSILSDSVAALGATVQYFISMPSRSGVRPS